MNIVIFGANGMLGNYIYNYFLKHKYHIIPLTRKDIDISTSNIDEIDNLFQKHSVNSNFLIINVIGLIPHAINNNSNYEITKEYFRKNCLFPYQL